MGKILFKVGCMLVLFLGISNYMMYLMTGQTPFSKDSFSLPSMSSPDISDALPGGGKETVYKWRDENGELHYSSEPPPENSKVETIEVDPNTNMVQGIRKESETETEGENVAAKPQVTLPQGNIYNPETIKKLVNDAQNVQKLMDDRLKAQEDIMSGK